MNNSDIILRLVTQLFVCPKWIRWTREYVAATVYEGSTVHMFVCPGDHALSVSYYEDRAVVRITAPRRKEEGMNPNFKNSGHQHRSLTVRVEYADPQCHRVIAKHINEWFMYAWQKFGKHVDKEMPSVPLVDEASLMSDY